MEDEQPMKQRDLLTELKELASEYRQQRKRLIAIREQLDAKLEELSSAIAKELPPTERFEEDIDIPLPGNNKVTISVYWDGDRPEERCVRVWEINRKSIDDEYGGDGDGVREYNWASFPEDLLIAEHCDEIVSEFCKRFRAALKEIKDRPKWLEAKNGR